MKAVSRFKVQDKIIFDGEIKECWREENSIAINPSLPTVNYRGGIKISGFIISNIWIFKHL